MAMTWTDYLKEQGLTPYMDENGVAGTGMAYRGSPGMEDTPFVDLTDEGTGLRSQWQNAVQKESGLPWFEDTTAQGYQPSSAAQLWNRMSPEQRTRAGSYRPEVIQRGLNAAAPRNPSDTDLEAAISTIPYYRDWSAEQVRKAQQEYKNKSSWQTHLKAGLPFIAAATAIAGGGGAFGGALGAGETAAGEFSFPTFDTGPGFGESLTSLVGGDTSGEMGFDLAGYDTGLESITAGEGGMGGGTNWAERAAVGGAEDMFNVAGSGVTAADTGGSGLMDFLKKVSPSTWLNLGGNVIGAGINAYGANRAAGIQSDAAKDANKTLLDMYNQNRADLEPWRTAGGNAITRAGKIMEPGGGQALLEMDPGYAFRLGEGNKAIDRAAAARGMYDSGPTLKALTRYGQDFASGEFTNAYNRLLALAGMGQTAATNTGAYGTNTAARVAENQIGVGNTGAAANISGYGGVATSLSAFLRQMQEQPFVDALTERMRRP